MSRDDEPPNDLKEFLPSTEDFARVLDGKAAEERTRQAVRKAEQSANFASALADLKAPPPEAPAAPAKASERAEYNPAKTVPPRTRRDTLEVQQRVEVPAALLDPRHRPTERIIRKPNQPVGKEDLAAVVVPPSTPPAPAVEREAAQPPAKRRGFAMIALVLAALVVVVVLASRASVGTSERAASVGASVSPTITAPTPATAEALARPSAVEPAPSEPAASASAEESALPVETSAAPTGKVPHKPHGNGTTAPDKTAHPLPKAVD